MSEPDEQPAPSPPPPLALHPVLDKVLERLQQDVTPERRDALSAFAKAFLRRLTPEELERSGDDHLAALTGSLFAFADARGTHAAAVRVFTPSQERDGYDTGGTVIQTNTDDSPFLVDSVSEELTARERIPTTK